MVFGYSSLGKSLTEKASDEGFAHGGLTLTSNLGCLTQQGKQGGLNIRRGSTRCLRCRDHRRRFCCSAWIDGQCRIYSGF